MDFKRARNGEWRENEIRFGAEYWEIWRQIDDEARVETKGKIPFDFQRGERGALDRQNKPWLCFYRDRETSFSVCFHESRVGVGEGREKLAARGNRATGTYRHADWKFVRSHAFYAFFQPWNPSRAIPSSRDEHSIPSITDLSSCRHRKNSPLSLFSPRPFPSSFFSLPPPSLSFPVHFIFPPFFPPFSFFNRWTRHRLRLACDR